MSYLGKTLYQFAAGGVETGISRFSARPRSPPVMRHPSVPKKEVIEAPLNFGVSNLKFAEAKPDMKVSATRKFSRNDIKPERYQEKENFGTRYNFEPSYGKTRPVDPGFSIREETTNWGESNIKFADESRFKVPLSEYLGKPESVKAKNRMPKRDYSHRRVKKASWKSDEVFYDEPMGHYQMVPFGKSKTAANKGIDPSPPSPSVSATPNLGFGGGTSMFGGALVGGGVSYLGSTPENRNFGTFVKGTAFGAAGGAVVSAVGSRGMMSASSGYAHGVSKKLGFGEGFTENIVDAAQKMESAQHRGVLFASGAMLAGGMFGTNRNRAQGLNSTRGNRFGG